MSRSLAALFERICLCACLASPLTAFSHGDIHEQLDSVTRQLLAEPQNAELYLRRGELHRVHQDWQAAAADYDRAEKYAPGMTIVDLARGRMLLDAGQFEAALSATERFLAARPEHVEGLVTRARIQARLGRRLAAAADFSRAIDLSGKGEPEYYLERAQALVAAGPEHIGEAIAGLDEGTKKLGLLVTLGLSAMQLEIGSKRYDAALARLEKLSAQSPRKETWLVRRAEILRTAGRPEEAVQAYNAALSAVASLPPHLRGTRMIAGLESKIRKALEEIAEQVSRRSE